MKISFLTLAGVLTFVQLSSTALAESTSVPSEGRFQTELTGSNKCLDIVNDGTNNQLTMADCGDFTGQFWHLKPTKDGRFVLQTEFTGQNKCLDIVNDGSNNKLTMADCGNITGQFWIVTEKQGSYRLQTEFTGQNKCLDVVNDGNNDKLIMADCGNFTGQVWKFISKEPQ